ncbi:MAG: hypothetical protein LBV72_00625 [Tannerella sp.]|jgi:hypothetical protein|nr:hypothetical protein [Tannerella sp.]
MDWIELIFGGGGVMMAILPVLAIAGLAAAGAGAIGSGITRKKQKQALNNMRAGVAKEQAENKSWYNANALSDYTQRADTQNLFKNLRDNLKRSRDTTTSTAAITGATPAAVAAAKERDTKAVSDTYSNVAAMGQQWKDNITSQYLRRKDYLSNKMLGLDQQGLQDYDRQSQNWGNLMNSGLNVAAGSAMSGYSSMIPSK